MTAKWSAPKAGHKRGRLVNTDPRTPQKKNRRGERKKEKKLSSKARQEEVFPMHLRILDKKVERLERWTKHRETLKV